MKLFKSSNIELIKECRGYFRCLLPSLNVKERRQKFISNTKIRSVGLHFVNIVMLCECTWCVYDTIVCV